MDNINVKTGINYYISGNKSGAQLVFIELLKHDLENEVAWFLLDLCVDDPEDRISLFQKALAINPNNLIARKGLAEAIGQKDPALNLEPDHDLVYHCPNCGNLIDKSLSAGLKQPGYLSKVITYPPLFELDKKGIAEKFLKSCEAALQGRNYDHALQYAEKILEIEPENIHAWINKAIATYWLTTEADNRFDEAMYYLGKAEKLDQNNPLIESTRKQLREAQCGWYIYLGDQVDELVGKIMDEYDSNYDVASGISDAKVKCQEHVLKAMNYYLIASKVDPTDLTSLSKMKYLAEFGDWLLWSSEVRRKIAYFEKIEQRSKECNRLTNLKLQLKESQIRLSKISKEKGLLVGIKILGAKRHITSLKQQISDCEKLIPSQ